MRWLKKKLPRTLPNDTASTREEIITTVHAEADPKAQISQPSVGGSWFTMAESTRFKDLLDNQKKHEIMFMEERNLRESNEKHIHNQLETLMSVQVTTQASMEANQRMIQQQIQSVVDQMQVYNRNKSVLGEGLSATAERGSISQPRRMSTPDLERSLSQTSYTPFPKVEFPHYDREDTRTWIKKCNRYFQIVTTITEEQKVPLASIHLEGKTEL
ncbi:hypothetical protein BUALT_Bualt01G0059500 [Buddleja alternifolia]|uniref:Uncharacterized protein n=1 Tax=Buddleja alternifolia TaxID=168488 RepID=A0AAV6YAU1_9LAMI|nr:hypothetical protein BUALT_Bualt01G0059500 [Buddleja alternifolia]